MAGIELVLPDLVLDELQRALTEKLGFGFGDERAREACTLLAGLATARPGSPSAVEAITGDPADDLILACAVEVGAEVLSPPATANTSSPSASTTA